MAHNDRKELLSVKGSYLRDDILAILRSSLDDGLKLRAIQVRCNVPDEVWDAEGWDADADRMDEAKPYG